MLRQACLDVPGALHPIMVLEITLLVTGKSFKE